MHALADDGVAIYDVFTFDPDGGLERVFDAPSFAEDVGTAVRSSIKIVNGSLDGVLADPKTGKIYGFSLVPQNGH